MLVNIAAGSLKLKVTDGCCGFDKWAGVEDGPDAGKGLGDSDISIPEYNVSGSNSRIPKLRDMDSTRSFVIILGTERVREV